MLILLKARIEGPFGDHTGYYSLEEPYPVFHLTCITHRKNPIYQTTIVGPPPMEDGFIGQGVRTSVSCQSFKSNFQKL